MTSALKLPPFRAAVLVFAGALITGQAPLAFAQQPGEAAHAEPQTWPAWVPALGAAVGLGGLATGLLVDRELGRGNGDCVTAAGGCFWGSVGSQGLQLGGVALITAWAWKRGEADRAAGRPHHPAWAPAGLVVGGLALAATTVASVWAVAEGLSACTDEGELNHSCYARHTRTPHRVSLAASTVLLVAAPLAAYGIGWEHGPGNTSALLLPAASRDAIGVALQGRF